MRALITGGNGFIGSHLVDAALEAGWQVSVYDRIDERFRHKQDGVTYVYGEIQDQGVPQQALIQADVVFHLACTTIHQTSNKDPAFDVQSNVVPTLKLLQQCVEARVGKFVFLSSGGTVYGIPRTLPISESHPTDPICSYGIHKLAIEKYLALFNRLYGLDYVALRPSNPYGERQDFRQEQGAVTVFLSNVARGEAVTIWGDGNVIRDYFYVGDLVQACIDAATMNSESHTLNVSSGKGLSLNELVGKIETVLGVEVKVNRSSTAARPFDVPELILDSSEAKRCLSWEPKVSLEEGIVRTWQWVLGILGKDG